MPNRRPDTMTDVRELLDRLATELRQTQRELECVRRRPNLSPYAVLILVLALGVSLATRSVGAQSPSRVVAPFTVVDENGQTLLEVVEKNGRANMQIGQVWLGTGSSGTGFVEIFRANNKPALDMGLDANLFGIRLYSPDDGIEWASIAEAKIGGGVFVANDANGKIRMLMSGQGQLHAVDAAGATRATMTTDGAFSIRNKNGTTIARLGESPGANGTFQLANSSGDAVVEAGLLPTGAGVVRTYPNGGVVGGPLGLPGTFIMGFLGSTKGK